MSSERQAANDDIRSNILESPGYFVADIKLENAVNPLVLELTKGAFTLVAVALGAAIGLYAYFRQKEYELTKQRYLEQGLDVVASAVEALLGTVSHNYARTLQLCRQYRENGAGIDLAELSRGFLDLDTSSFHQTAHYRVGSLLNDQVVWNSFQSVMVYASMTNALFTQEIPEAIRKLAVMPEGKRDRQADADEMAKSVQEKHDEQFMFADFTHSLHVLSLLLEQTRLSRKAIAKFNLQGDVRDVVQKMRAAYPEEVKASGATAV